MQRNRIPKYLKEFHERKGRGDIPKNILMSDEVYELHKAYEKGGMFELITTCFYAGFIAGTHNTKK